MSKFQIGMLALTRIVFGLLFLLAGVEKFLSDFSAQSYLSSATSGPLATAFQVLSGNPVIDFLVIFGEMGIGLGLLSGILFRFSSFSGITMMLLYYASSFPPQTGIINLHIMYILVFLLLMAFNADNFWSLKSYLKKFLPDSPTN